MFTGLIEDLGRVRELRLAAASAQLTVATAIPTESLVLGESIAVNGVCLTVVTIGRDSFTADVSPETLGCSTLGRLTTGSPVNLERALRLSDRLGGHLVSGHIDGTGEVVGRVREANAVRFTIRAEPALTRFVVAKGSIAVDGISLTANKTHEDRFELTIIPHTLDVTTLRDRQIGSAVNLEVDIIGKYVERFLGLRQEPDKGQGLDLEVLAKHGFL